MSLIGPSGVRSCHPTLTAALGAFTAIAAVRLSVDATDSAPSEHLTTLTALDGACSSGPTLVTTPRCGPRGRSPHAESAAQRKIAELTPDAGVGRRSFVLSVCLTPEQPSRGPPGAAGTDKSHKHSPPVCSGVQPAIYRSPTASFLSDFHPQTVGAEGLARLEAAERAPRPKRP